MYKLWLEVKRSIEVPHGVMTEDKPNFPHGHTNLPQIARVPRDTRTGELPVCDLDGNKFGFSRGDHTLASSDDDNIDKEDVSFQRAPLALSVVKHYSLPRSIPDSLAPVSAQFC